MLYYFVVVSVSAFLASRHQKDPPNRTNCFLKTTLCKDAVTRVIDNWKKKQNFEQRMGG